ncbi:MAG TPA: hypothetical protein VFJ97_16240 [Dermatophilaceae bacterium]|nr:hypothetical protein [Dermatophilaceae bacterium]
MNPVLVPVFPAPADTRCRESAAALVGDLARTLPDVELVATFLDGSPAGLAGTMAAMTRPAVVVPAFAAGTAEMMAALFDAAGAAARVEVSRPLGPDPLLARATMAKLRAAGARWGDAAVLVAAPGACDSLAMRETRRAADLLASEWGPRVSAAVGVSGADLPEVGEAIAEWRAVGHSRVFVVPYDIAYAAYLPSLHAVARAAGAAGVTGPLGPHRLVTDLIVIRYEQAGRPRRDGTVHAA